MYATCHRESLILNSLLLATIPAHIAHREEVVALGEIQGGQQTLAVAAASSMHHVVGIAVWDEHLRRSK